MGFFAYTAATKSLKNSNNDPSLMYSKKIFAPATTTLGFADKDDIGPVIQGGQLSLSKLAAQEKASKEVNAKKRMLEMMVKSANGDKKSAGEKKAPTNLDKYKCTVAKRTSLLGTAQPL